MLSLRSCDCVYMLAAYYSWSYHKVQLSPTKIMGRDKLIAQRTNKGQFAACRKWCMKVLNCKSKVPRFQSHLQRRFRSLLGALSPTSKNSIEGFPSCPSERKLVSYETWAVSQDRLCAQNLKGCRV